MSRIHKIFHQIRIRIRVSNSWSWSCLNLTFYGKKIWIFSIKIPVLFPFSPLDILANSFNITGKMILLPPFSYFHVIFFPPVIIFPCPSQLDILHEPPPPHGGKRNFIQPWEATDLRGCPWRCRPWAAWLRRMRTRYSPSRPANCPSAVLYETIYIKGSL